MENTKKKNVFSVLAVICSLTIFLEPLGLIFALLALSRSKELGVGRYGAVFAISIITIKLLGIGAGYYLYSYVSTSPEYADYIKGLQECDKAEYTCYVKEGETELTCFTSDNEERKPNTLCNYTFDNAVFSEMLKVNGNLVVGKIANYAYGHDDTVLSYDKFVLSINDTPIGTYTIGENVDKSDFASFARDKSFLFVVKKDNKEYIAFKHSDYIKKVTGTQIEEDHEEYYTIYDEEGKFIEQIDTLNEKYEY